ncbi:hypothetical protein [Streptomyces sp. NPDC090445]|uniref:hypothetical protein n=1 Tax=Streptomyces sp. NPDC090445 TaxID=3365963 RepID=UPI00381C9EF9
MAALGLIGGAGPAQAAGSYNIMVRAGGTAFVADYCLLTTTSGGGHAQCSGNKGANSTFRMGVVHTPGDRVWTDVNIVGGEDRQGIDLLGKHYIRVHGDLGSVSVCGWKSYDSYKAGNRGAALHGAAHRCDTSGGGE